MKLQNKILIYLLILLFPVYFILAACGLKPVISYTIILISSSLISVFVFVFVLKDNITAKHLIVLLSISILIRIAFMFAGPVGTDDYYRYVWDGKVIANGINPYRYAPDNPALNFLHTRDMPKRINFADMKTIYPPLGEILFYLAYLIGGDGFFGIKLLLFLSDLLTMLGLFLILRKIKLDYKFLLIYALSPLIIFQFFLDAHLDGLGLPFLIFALYFYLSKRKIESYILIGLSICIKPLALIFIPILFFNEKTFKDKLKTALIPLSVVAAMYLPFIFNGSPFQALLKFTENWTFNGAVFDLLDSFIHDNQSTRLICAVLLLIFYFPVILSRKDLFNKIYLSVFLLFIFSPVVHPWYLSWLAVLLPFIPRASGVVYTGLAGLTAFTILTYHLTGVWNDYTLVLLFEYIPVIILFIGELVNPGRFLIFKQNT